jgi:3-isopropylmalate/(R)-2-methylmalate dehydratase small subunit
LLVLVADTGRIAEGDALQVCLDSPTPELRVISQRSRSIACEPMPELMRAMREAGGLVPYLRLHGKLA